MSLHFALLVLALIFKFSLSVPAAMILTGIFAVVTFGFLGYVETKRDPFWITPLSIYFLWNTFGMGFSAAYIGSLVVEGRDLYFSGLSYIDPEDLGSGYVLALIGSLFLHIGLQSMRPKPSPEMAPPSQVRATWLLVTLSLLWLVSVAQLAFPASFVRFGAPATALGFGAHTALIIFALVPPITFRMSEITHGLFMVIGTLILFVASAGSNSKLYYMLALVPFFCFIAARRALHRYVPGIAAVALFLYLTVVAPTVNLSRQTRLRAGETRVDAQIDAFQRYSPLSTGEFDQDFYLDQADALLKRQFEPISVGYLVGEVKRRGFLYGETMKSIGISLIPRLFWPDKPNVIKGAWFTYYTGGAAREEESTYSVGMDAAGELYWNFGVPGVMVGMLVLGAMFGGLWRMAGYDTRYDPAHHLLYTTIALGMVNLPEASSRYVSCVAFFVIFGVVFTFLDYRKKRLTRVPVIKI